MLLDALPKRGVVAEIGVAFGDFTSEILERACPATLHLIDSWESERYTTGLDHIREKFKKDISREQVLIRRGQSIEVLKSLPVGAFDWVYLDTNHTYATTIEELRLAERAVKMDGFIAGHDYCTGNVIDAVPYGVIEAVAEFCYFNNWRFIYLTLETRGHMSFCLEKIK